MPDLPNNSHPWQISESAFNGDGLGVTETVFALSNGYIGTRGTLDEGHPDASPGTFMAGVFEYHPLSYPEDGYGRPDRGQAIIGVAEGTPIRLEVDGRRLDISETPPHVHQRTLDLRAGTLLRTSEWTTPAGDRVRLQSCRLVSLSQRSVTAVHYEVEALDNALQVVIRSELAVNRTALQIDNPDPRVGEALDKPFVPCAHRSFATGGLLVHRTRSSGIGVAAAVRHDAQMPDGGQVSTAAGEDEVLTTLVVGLQPGEKVTLVKYICHASSADGSGADLETEARAALESARARGWNGLCADQRSVLDRFWEDADVEIDGDAELQQGIRFNLFQVFQASAFLGKAPIGAKALTGSGYSGHTFWDIEGFVVPMLTLLRPDSAACLLRWRASTLDAARQRAGVLGLKGAAFAWRTIDGREASAYWPASTAAVHLNAAISRAFMLHANVAGLQLTETQGVDVLVETARMWASIEHQDDAGRVHLFGVTGPDEYTGVVDDNVFTNLMAQSNLRAAADACDTFPEPVRRLSVTRSEIAEWRRIADAMYVPYDDVRQVHPANQGFTTYREWNFDDNAVYPIQAHAHYAKIYRRQVVKQADLVLALWWCADAFTDEQTARDLDYYEQRTVRDSSLSAAVQSVVSARVGHLDLALAYLRECALADLRNVQGDSHQGVHLAALAGAWLALVCGFGGLRLDDEKFRLAPRLSSGLSRIAFRLSWHGCRLAVEITRSGTTVSMIDSDNEDLPVWIDDVATTLTASHPVLAPLLVPHPTAAPPSQPPGREPQT
ncbi:glycoside hydrolase family 65 protein [Arthrobacter tumbae]|uniref:glycoside hydrolase family 65 protein n=1 Tax=Arthrobacter tumbae TaxID=163874 RepID=UPI001958770A|nr:glycoside hydrolase family 65 protein [Arthrobacter tumbae]MBM7779915.1 trehalose/maltose hydrolase-like predicted phosphorylase [Arthrobacter tumbae]